MESTFVNDLALVTGVGALTGIAARALRLPSVLGYLFAGLIVGPGLPIPLFADTHRTEALAAFGVVLVMFAIGLEFRVGRLLRVLPGSGFTALMQVATLAWAGFTVGSLLGFTPVGAAFLGACLAISSTMVVTGIFSQQPVPEDVREHTLGVLVVQDVVAIVLMAVMTAVAAGQAVAAGDMALMVAQLGGVLIGMFAIGMLVVPRLVRYVIARCSTEMIAVLSTGLAFGFATLTEASGYSGALGAFVAGMLVAESGHAREVEHAIEPLRAVFAAVFFVSIGMAVDPSVALANLHVAAAIAAVIVVAQLVSVAGSGMISGIPMRRAVLSGLALGQIGEFSFILATIGAAAGATPPSLLATLVTAATITAFTTPLLLRRGDALVGWIDRHTPDRVLHLLALQQAWVERLRAHGGSAGPARHAARALVVDWLSLVLLAATALAFREPLARWLHGNLPLPDALASVLLDLLALALAAPMFLGLLRAARALARAAAGAAPTAATRRLVDAVATLALILGVGLPALAILRPLMRGPWADALLLAAVVTALVVVWRSLGAVEGEFRSGAVQVAHRLARHAGPSPQRQRDETLVPGLDRALVLPLGPGAFAVGHTLKELDLRARTGATVVAIHKPDADVLLPTGHERLEAGDVLALAGADEAIARARALALRGPESDPTEEVPFPASSP